MQANPLPTIMQANPLPTIMQGQSLTHNADFYR